MAGGVPNLGLDGLVIDGERPRLELDPDGGFGIEAELVPGEPCEELGLADGGVADEDDLEHVVNLLVEFSVHVGHPKKTKEQTGSDHRGTRFTILIVSLFSFL